jgi:DNA-binding CsgD family transcriptional regulator
LQWAGRLDESDAFALIGFGLGVTLDAALLRGVSAYQLGMCAYWRGAARTAQRYLEEAIDVMRDTDVGFLPSACDHLAAVTGRPTDDDMMRFPLYETERLRLAGVAAAGRREYERARELAAAAASAAQPGGLAMQELFAHWDHARWGGIEIAAGEIGRVASICEGELAPMLATAAIAWSNADGLAIEHAATELERLGFVLWAAELARVAAHAFADAGFAARAAGADARADRLLARCEGSSTFLTSRRLDQEVPELTRREREIVELAVLGTTNADIAALLSISVRTVEAHLQHVYTKLGVSSRQELAEQFGSGAGPTT